jgi:ATP-dependent exoDNAse (exonuclease V) beta subunit
MVSKPPGRPSGRRFGTLVHAVLRDAPLNAPHTEIKALVESRARTVSASSEEADAAINCVGTALEHELIQRARKAERCYREAPLTVPLPDRGMLEGTVDLAYLENGVWTIVDFKTDADLKPKRAHYERQLQWYAMAFSQVTGQRVRACLLGI